MTNPRWLSGMLFFGILISSCSSSLIYSPSSGVPDRPLEQNEIVVSGSAEMLPETRPEGFANTGDFTAMGGSLQVGYGFSNRFSMLVRGSADLSDKMAALRSTYSITGLYHWSRSTHQRIIWMNRVGIVMNNNSVQGYGVQSAGLWQYDMGKKLVFTGGIGGIWGFHSLERQVNTALENRIPMGWGILFHGVFAYRLSQQWILQGEITPIWQNDDFDRTNRWLFSPSIGISYRFSGKKNHATHP